MNVNGDILKQGKDIGHQTIKDTTSNESLRNIAIAGITAGIMEGISVGLNEMNAVNTTVDTANTANDVRVMQLSPSETTLTFNPPSTAYSPSSIPTSTFASGASDITLAERSINALRDSMVQTVASSAAQSAVNGDSFQESLRNSVRNVLINAAGQVALDGVANSAKAGEINNVIHIASVSTIGCAMAIAGNNNCASGAASSVVGAMIGGASAQNTDVLNKQQSNAIAQLAGAITAAAIAGPDSGNSVFAASQIAQATQNVYNEIGILLTNDQKSQIDQELLQGNREKAQELLDQFFRGKDLTDSQREKLTSLFTGETSGNVFLAGLTDDDKSVMLLTDQNGKPTSIGLFFDGTGNNANVDANNIFGTDGFDHNKNVESNVFRLSESYNGLPKYVSGVGSSGGLDNLCQGFGCGLNAKENTAMNFISEKYDTDNPKLLVIDEVGFSRGASIARDFGNTLVMDGVIDSQGNQIIPPQYIILRSELLFDSVASFDIPGNGIDLGKDFSIPKDTFAIQVTAANENRNQFDLQSIKFSDGTLANPNWVEQSFLGNHSDIGGSYAQGAQGKQNDIQFYTLNWMTNQANHLIPSLNEGEKIFNSIPESQQPSPYFESMYNQYNQASISYNQNPTQENQIILNAAKSILNDNYIHSENFYLGAPWNYNIGSDRGVFYPNDKFLPLVK